MATNQQNFRVRNGLTIDGATNGSSSFANPATGSDVSFTLPGVYPASNGYVLASTTTGVLSWVANPDTNTTYTYTASSTTGGSNLNLVGSDSTTNTIKLTDGTGVTNTYVSATEVSINIGQDVATTATPTFAGANLGNVTVGVVDDQTISTSTGNLFLSAAAGGYVAIFGDNSSPAYAQRNTTATTGSVRALSLVTNTTATPAVGLGPSLEFVGETAPGVFKNGGLIAVVSTDITSSSEDFRMDFRLMRNGASYVNKLSLFSNADLEMGDGGKLFIQGSTSGYTALGAPATGSNITYTLPGADGTSGYVLSTNGSGTLSWVANPDTNTTYTYTASTATGGANLDLIGSDATTNTIKLSNGTGVTNTRVSATEVSVAIGQDVATTASPTFAAGSFSSVIVRGSTSGTNTLVSPAVAGTQTYILPTGYPAASGYVLSATTGGTMSWVAQSGGGGAGETFNPFLLAGM